MVLEADRPNTMADEGRGENEEQQRAAEQTNGVKGAAVELANREKSPGVGIQAKSLDAQENGTALQATTESLQGDAVTLQDNGGTGLHTTVPALPYDATPQEHDVVVGLKSNGLDLQSNITNLKEIRADLQEAFRIIRHTPEERLISITLKMDESGDSSEQLVRAIALVALRRPADALRQLQELTTAGCCIATYLSGQVRANQGQVENLRVDSFQLPEPKSAALHDLARVFNLLVQERLCDAAVRDQAYQVALLDCANRGAESGHTCDSNLDKLKEEVNRVCGTEISCQALPLLSNSPGHLVRGCISPGSLQYSNPSSLQSSSNSSLPSHLEISAPPTQPARPSPHSSDSHIGVSSAASTTRFDSLSSGARTGAAAAQPTGVMPAPVPSHLPVPASAPPQPPLAPATDIPTQCTAGKEGTQQLVTSVSTGVESLRLPPDPSPHDFSRCNSAPEVPSSSLGDEEPSPVFYSFVILHAPEDADQAEELRTTLEAATSGTGATFSEDFAVPGRPTLACLDDAIDNSAFTVLLLTRNFTSRMQEVLTDSALINSIDHRHKYNSVIPLLPSQNPLPQASMPKVLRTIIPLKEGGRNFSGNARKAISPQKVAVQKKKWEQEQEVRRQEERRRKIQQDNRKREEAIRRSQEDELLYRQNWELYRRQQSMPRFNPAPPFHPPASSPSPQFYPPPASGRGAPPSAPSTHYPPPNPGMSSPFWGPPPQGQSMHMPGNISIHNAQCIMIGNDSTMTIGDPGVIRFNDADDYN
ncbi:TIR domain-containing adapter molecule 1 [Engraulis encrasicolus]|uniref:TIR domain-containing adapter molecule 1 n=1 Tax=Engraulis encrasicolus TaxID=184585 RepID=UPI002FD5FB8E